MSKSGHLLFPFSCVRLISSDCEFGRFFNCCVDNHNVAFTNVLFILLLLLSIKAALLSLSVFGDHELGVFMTIGDPGNGAGGQAKAIQWPGQLLPSVTHSKSAGNKFA